ncbi:5-methyltetrahydropteroyltriglutamate--homocysteine S-methyltransferase [Membranihabitans marinus]|uniref:5-methyltetrahydropteroyltriglutamate-- homocysteine S-methyltransferase n=1 Tax=Membranihabitans marinus TaxID=1227546 RepID=UPI001F0248F5|nr:5-methyltetrahydropteroyltriglutamate--homocysteine S-methyltransferase [Membranihabitans marinus]
MQTQNLGYPRIGSKRELKKACEKYWSGKINLHDLQAVGADIRKKNWLLQQKMGIDLIPSNDFAFYDQVLDMSLTVNAIPEQFRDLQAQEDFDILDLYFAMARGYQKDGFDITAMEMTKYFDSNYHYIVPEFKKDQKFSLFSTKIIDEFKEALKLGLVTKPVLIGPISYLLLGKEKEEGFHRIELIDSLLPVYIDILSQLEALGADWIQLDEPFLSLDLSPKAREAFSQCYTAIRQKFPKLKILLATYFEGLRDNMDLALSLPVSALHLDLVRAPEQWVEIADKVPDSLSISLGIVDGRNIWKNDFQASLKIIENAVEVLGEDRILIGPSSSLLHCPCDLDLEKKEDILTPEIKNWLAFAKQKIGEISLLRSLAIGKEDNDNMALYRSNQAAIASRRTSTLIHNARVKNRCLAITDSDAHRKKPFSLRRAAQQQSLQLPLYPTTTIGSFPQTKSVRGWRAKYKKGLISKTEYENLLKEETTKSIRWQEKIDIDVLVHGEFERNDMVEYFGEQLNGFVFTQFAWVQSYGSRCVKPPIIYGDIERSHSMTVEWTAYAQSLTQKPVKGMLTGPVTILQWSFVRNDQPRSETCQQIALAIRDEVVDLEKEGIKIIQIDEPAIREGLPLRKNDWSQYLNWAVRAFRIAASGVRDETQIHSHMCYSEFNDIIENIRDMDADVITIECSRSQMELLDAFAEFNYPNEIGPGVYDIHSPRVPSKKEMIDLLNKAKSVIPENQLWVNPDCGLKTRDWEETEKALESMVEAAKEMRKSSKVVL